MWIETRQNRGGSWSLVARVRVAGMSAPKRAFLIGTEPHTTQKKALAAARKLGVLEAAERWGADQERRLRDEKRRAAPTDVAKITVARLIDEYLKDDKTRALRSVADSEQRLRFWRAEIGTQRIFDEVTAPVLRAARDKLKRRGLGAATINRYVAGLRACWRWGQAAALVSMERAWPPKLMLPEPRGRTRYLNDAELAALLTAATAHPHVHAAIVVSIATGVRAGELLRLRWADVSLTEGATFVSVHESKTDKPRRVYLPPSAVSALKGLRALPVASVNGPVFLNELTGQPMNEFHLRNRWRKYVLPAARKAAPHLFANLRWHDLRHTAASYLAQDGATLLEIGSVLGHANPATTAKYSHLIQGKALPAHAGLDARLRRGKGEQK